MTNDEETEIRAYVAERAAARARGEHIDSDERREVLLLAALDEARDAIDVLNDRAERAWRELHDLDPVLPVDCGSRVDAARQLKADLDEARGVNERWERVRALTDVARLDAEWQRLARERDEARSQLAALHAATARFVHSLGDDEEDHPTLGRVRVSRADDGAEENLDRALADLATAAAEHDRRVRAPVEAERDQFAAALAELRDHARTHGYAALAAALTADLAAQREARIRADERAKALREAEVMLRRRAARAFSAGATAVGLDGEVVRMHAGIYEAMVGEANALVKMADEADEAEVSR